MAKKAKKAAAAVKEKECVNSDSTESLLAECVPWLDRIYIKVMEKQRADLVKRVGDHLRLLRVKEA